MPIPTSWRPKEGEVFMGRMSHIAIIGASLVCRILGEDAIPPKSHHDQMAKKSKERAAPENHLRQWREFREMTQEYVAANVKPPTKANVISLIETGERRLSDKWARRLAPVLQVQPGWLLDHDPETMDGRVMETFSKIPENMKEQAFKVLETFAKRGSSK